MATKLRKLVISEVSLLRPRREPARPDNAVQRDTPTEEIEVPEEFDVRSFNASGKGPMHSKLFTMYDDYRRAMASPDSAFRAAWNDLTPDEKQAIRDEESAHAAAVAAHETAEQEAREKELNKMDDATILLKGAHAINAGAIENTIGRGTWASALRNLAEGRRGQTESIEQAVARLVQTDPDARALMKASLSGVADDVPAAQAQPIIKADSPLGKFQKDRGRLCCRRAEDEPIGGNGKSDRRSP